MGKKSKVAGEGGKPEKGAGKADWWRLGQYVPEDRLDIVLLSGGGAAVLSLLLWVIWIFVASGRASSLEEAEKKIGELGDKIASMSETTVVEDLKKKLDDEVAARQDAEKKAGDLDGKLRAAEKEKGSLQGDLDGLKADKEGLDTKLSRTVAELKQARADYKTLERDAKDVAALRKELNNTKEERDRVKAELASLRKMSAVSGSEQQRVQMELQRKTREYESEIADLKRQIEESDARMKELDVKLAKFPKKPFTEEEAALRYDELLDEAANVTDRDERIDIFLNAKRALAGTKYERKANGLWAKEKKLKQRDIDQAAYAVYKEACDKVRAHPQAYDENVATLEKALEDENVVNSRYKGAIEKLINKQKEQKAAAAAAAAEEPEE